MTTEEKLTRLIFRPERSRQVWRNVHVDTRTIVTDLKVNDHGGFQGGCRQFVVVTNEPGPPGPPPVPDQRRMRDLGPRGHHVHPLWSWLQHWEPTGEFVAVEELDEWQP